MRRFAKWRGTRVRARVPIHRSVPMPERILSGGSKRGRTHPLSLYCQVPRHPTHVRVFLIDMKTLSKQEYQPLPQAGSRVPPPPLGGNSRNLLLLRVPSEFHAWANLKGRELRTQPLLQFINGGGLSLSCTCCSHLAWRGNVNSANAKGL